MTWKIAGECNILIRPHILMFSQTVFQVNKELI